MIKPKDITLPIAILGCVAVPSVCALVYLLVDKLIDAGENLGGIVVAVMTILGFLGIQGVRTRAQIEKVEKLANGNLEHERAARTALTQQALHLAAQSPPGTYVPSVPVAEPGRGDAGNTSH